MTDEEIAELGALHKRLPAGAWSRGAANEDVPESPGFPARTIVHQGLIDGDGSLLIGIDPHGYWSSDLDLQDRGPFEDDVAAMRNAFPRLLAELKDCRRLLRVYADVVEGNEGVNFLAKYQLVQFEEDDRQKILKITGLEDHD